MNYTTIINSIIGLTANNALKITTHNDTITLRQHNSEYMTKTAFMYKHLFTSDNTIKKSKRHKQHNLIVSLTSLSGMTLFNASAFEYSLMDEAEAHDTKQAFYNTFDFNGKVYKRANLASTLSQAKKRTTKKASASADNAFYETSSKCTFATLETPTTNHCENDFMNYAINNKLAEKIVYTKLMRLFGGNINKKTGELVNGNMSALDLLNNVNMPIDKEDLTQAVYLHLWENALDGTYYMEEEKAVFDILACMRVVGNMMDKFSNVRRNKYKTVISSIQAMEEAEDNSFDIAYYDNALESIDNDLLNGLRAYVIGHGGNNAVYNTLKNYSIMLIIGYKKTTAADILGISRQAVHKLTKRYLIPYLEKYYEKPEKPETVSIKQLMRA